MRSRAAAAFGLAVLAASAVAGCGPTHSTSSPGAQGGSPAAGSPVAGPPAAQCGTVHTAAGVPVQIDVQTGSTACRIAMAVERAYAHAVASGKVPGNGGGAPVTIKGWICQGYNTPQVLATGHASACHKNGSEILAILPTPSPSPT
jgi:hypothetical protein